jgi:hypothetical protein
MLYYLLLEHLILILFYGMTTSKHYFQGKNGFVWRLLVILEAYSTFSGESRQGSTISGVYNAYGMCAYSFAKKLESGFGKFNINLLFEIWAETGLLERGFQVTRLNTYSTVRV